MARYFNLGLLANAAAPILIRHSLNRQFCCNDWTVLSNYTVGYDGPDYSGARASFTLTVTGGGSSNTSVGQTDTDQHNQLAELLFFCWSVV